MPAQLEYETYNALLLEELANHNTFFDSLVDMIPAKLYVSGNTGDESYNPKYRKGQHKESKEARRARNKAAKIAKFDPSKAETTLEAKMRKAAEAAEDLEDNDCASNDVAVGSKNSTIQGGKKVGVLLTPPSSTSGSGVSRIEALRARLHAKIAEKQANRPSANGDEAVAVSKRAARRAEKRRRVEAAKARNYSNVGRETAKKLRIADMAMGGTKINTLAGAVGSREDDLAGIDFGGIAGLSKKAHYLDNKSLVNAGGKKKSLDRLLKEAEKKRQRLKELKSGVAEDKEKAAKIVWGDAIKEASGERVRDDPALIKKALKRKSKKKAKSAEAWKSRMEQAKVKMDERQNIRSHNLDKRKIGGATGANLSKKRIEIEDQVNIDSSDKKKKRGRLGPHSGKGRAGFEGKKHDFINKGKLKGKSSQ